MVARNTGLVCIAVAMASWSASAAAELPTVHALTPESAALGGALTARGDSAGAIGSNPAAAFVPGGQGKRLQMGGTRFERDDRSLEQEPIDGFQGAFVSQQERFGWGLGWFSNGQYVTDGRLAASPATRAVFEQSTMSLALGFALGESASFGASLDALDLMTEAGDEEYDGEWGYSMGIQFAPKPWQGDVGGHTLGVGLLAGAAFASEAEASLENPGPVLVSRSLTARPQTLRAGLELAFFWLSEGLRTRLRFPLDGERREYASLQDFAPAAPTGTALVVNCVALGAEWEWGYEGSPWTLALRAGAAVEEPDSELLERLKRVSAGVAVIYDVHSLALGSRADDSEGREVNLAYQYWF